MTLRVKCSFLKINTVLKTCRNFDLVQKCFSSKWSHSGSWGNNDIDIFMEDNLEEKINADGGALLSRQQPALKRTSAKKEAELRHRRFIKRKIIEKKENAFYGQTQPSLLSWAAKAQIKHLNKKDPTYWTPEMLAHSFPVSPDVILKILKNDRQLPPDEEYILEHDRKVYMNWLKLKKAKEDFIEGRPVDPKFRSVVESERLNLMKNATGSRALPIPASEFLTRKALAEKRRPETRGEFSAILEDYRKQKESVKQERSMKHMELEDPSYVSLLNGISELTTEDDSKNDEQSYQEQTTHDKYQDEELFYDEYDDNVQSAVYKHGRNVEVPLRNQRTDGESGDITDGESGDITESWNNHNQNRRQYFSKHLSEPELYEKDLSLDQIELSDLENSRKSYHIDERNDTEFQKSTTKWMKENAEYIERNSRKVKKY